MTDTEWIEIGVLTRVHGLKGGIFLRANDRRSEFGDYSKVLLTRRGEAREFTVTQTYVSAGQPVLVLNGVQSREAAEELLQCHVSILRSEAADDESDVLVGDLIGLKVMANNQGELSDIGEIVSVVDFGAQENIEIKMHGRKTTALYPMMDEYVKEIDMDAGTITIIYIPEFLEENA